MARNGVGVFSLPQAPYVAGTVISSTSVNSNLSDIANALTQSIASDGQTTPTANLPMGGYRHTNVANATARDNYAAMGQIQDGAGIWCGTAGGTANALTLTPAPSIPAYAAGQVFRFTAGASPNTGATTVAVSGLTAVAIQASGAALTGGEISAGRQYSILYDGAAFQLQAFAPSTAPTYAANTFLANATGSTAAATGIALAASQLAGRGSTGNVAALSLGDLLSIAGTTISAALPRSYLSGLGMVRNTGTPTTHLDIAAGTARDSTNAANLTLSATLTKRLDAAWAVGSGNGGLDTGSRANNTWYHVHLIRRSDTGVVDALFSLSATAPTLPTNYDQRRRIGSVRTDGSSNLIAFIQDGDRFVWDVPVNDFDVGAPGTSANLRTLTVPTGVNVFAVFSIKVAGDAATGNAVLVTDPAQTDTTPTRGLCHIWANDGDAADGYAQLQIRTNASAQVRHRQTISTRAVGTTHGWIDTRGREA